MLDFKNDLNKLFQKNSDELLTKFLSISALPKDCYLRMQTSTLCEYDKDHVYFIHTNEEFRIKSFFELIKSFYSLRGVNEHFSKAFSTKTLEFLNNIPDNFTETVFLKYQEELYLKYWEDISPDKYNFFKALRVRYSEKISAEAYTECLYFFLKDDFELKKQKNFDKFINKINANMYLALNINKKILDKEFEKYNRFPPAGNFIDFTLHNRENIYVFNHIEHPAIRSIVFYNTFFSISMIKKDYEQALKWIFIQSDITSFFFKICFKFYKDNLLVYTEDNKNSG